MRVPVDEAEEVYARLRDGAVDAPLDLFELFHGPLVRVLQVKWEGFSHDTTVEDNVTDAIFRLCKDPERYRPERGSLWNYLYQDAHGDIANAWDRSRRGPQLVSFDPVEHDHPDGNTSVEDDVMKRLEPTDVPAGVSITALREGLQALLAEPADRALVKLMLAGERDSADYAQVLEITDLPVLEQRRQIKQHKDRINARLKRLGRQVRRD